MTTSRTSEADHPTNDFDPFYRDLERRLLALIAEDEEDCVESMTTKRLTPACVTPQRFMLEQQTENYLCWKHDFANHIGLVPIGLTNVRGYTRNGTGVFIPHTIDTLGGHNTSGRRADVKEEYRK